MDAKAKLSAARLMARQKAPYFTSALMGLIVREAPGLGTMGVTDAWLLLIDFAVINQWSVPEIAGALLHEVGHVLRDHAGRCKRLGADPTMWNLAGDAEINDDLLKTWKLPGQPITPALLGCKDGGLAETYYASLRKMAPPKSGPGGDGESGDGDPSEGDAQGQGDKGKGGNKPGPGWCGSGAGRALPGEPSDGGRAHGRSEADVSRIRRQTADAIRQEASKGRGSVPGGWATWADTQLAPARIPWTQKLSRATRARVAEVMGASNYSYARPSRRQGSLGYGDGFPVLPVLRAPRPRVAVGIDTSGSMGIRELARALSETRGVLSTVNAEIGFIACDAAVSVNKKIRSWAELAKQQVTRGGTDFNPVFAAVEEMNPRPDVFVFFTDGQGPCPISPPSGVHVIWVLVGGSHSRPFIPTSAGSVVCTWGEFIEVDDEPETEAA